MGVGSTCPPVSDNIVTPRHLFSFLLVLTQDKRDLSKLAKKKEKKSLKVPKKSFLYKIARRIYFLGVAEKD